MLFVKHRRAARFFLGSFLILSSERATAQGSRPDTTQAVAARQAIIATANEFSARYMRGDIAGMLTLYTPDGVILPPGRPAASGIAALTEYWTPRPGSRVLEHRSMPDSIVVVGPVAYDWGTYVVRGQDASSAVHETNGKYLIVWREVSPGTWRMHVDMWNAGPGAPRQSTEMSRRTVALLFGALGLVGGALLGWLGSRFVRRA